MLVKIYIAQIARLSTLQSISDGNQIIFKPKLCVKEKGTTIYCITPIELKTNWVLSVIRYLLIV
jgi:hypothetical protein